MPNLSDFRKLIPFVVFLVFAGIAMTVWQNQNRHQLKLLLRHTETSADQVRIRIEGLMKARMASLEILAQRWVERMPPDFSKQRFLKFANALYTHNPGFREINWIDQKGTIQWVFPEKDFTNAKINTVFLHSDSRYHAAFYKAGKDFGHTMTPCLSLFHGGLGFETFQSLIYDGKIQGYLNGVFQIDKIMVTCLAENIQNNFIVSVYEDKRLIYINRKLRRLDHEKNRPTVSRTIRFSGKIWELDLTPGTALYPSEDFRNLSLLIFGLGVSITLALLLNLLLERIRMYKTASNLAVKEVNSRRHAEGALLKSEKRFRTLVENSLTGICIVQDNRIVYYNPEQERLYGPMSGSPKFSDIHQNIHPDDIEKVNSFSKSMALTEVENLETDLRFYPTDKNSMGSNVKWVHCRTTLIDYQGKEAILVNMMDITRTKELEHLLKIRDKMTSLGRVAAGMAHEIRNPLSGINIYLNTLEKIYNRGDDLEKIKGIIGQIQSASNKIESIIKRVMDFSKPGTPKFIKTDINQPIDEALSLSSVTLRKRGIAVEKVLADDLPQPRLDHHLIEQVILNLINNATESMKHMDSEKKIEVAASLKGKNIIVSVSDSGPGVPEEIADNVFDPFYTTKDGSTGIGLSLSNRIVEDHGGAFTLSKSKWGGARFSFEIPLERGND